MFKIHRPRLSAMQISIGILFGCAFTSIAQEPPIRSQNTSKYIGEGRYQWTVFLNGGEREIARIDSVEYLLHPTFSNPRRRVTEKGTNNKAYALSSSGWGEFWISITVYFNDGTRRVLRHYLELENTLQAVKERTNPALMFQKTDFKDLSSLAIKLRDSRDPLSNYLRRKLSPDTQKLLRSYKESMPVSDTLQKALIDELNRLLTDSSLFRHVTRVKVPEETKRYLEKNAQSESLIRNNKLFLEESYPSEIVQSLKARNISKQVADGRYTWTVFLDGKDEILASIDKVEYVLHPTFPNPRNVVDERGNKTKSFALSANGWGEFWIYITIHFKDGGIKQLSHYLELS